MDSRAPLPLHVVHAVATANFAGVERYVSYVAPALAGRGVKVTAVGGDKRRMSEALLGTGVSHRAAADVASVVRALLSERPVDVIHAHMTSAEIAATIAKPLVRSRLVVTRHFGANRGSTPWGRAAGRVAARAVDRQIAISHYVAGRVEDGSVVLLNAVPCAEEGAHDEPVVLVAQRLQREKDGSLAIDAWALSGLAEQGWRLVIAGDGAERQRLQLLARQRGVSASVDFPGFVDDVHELMDRASVFLATAPGEPFGLSVAEAMARSLPVVAAAGGGHLETAGAAVPEAMFPPGDAAAAAELLARLAADPDLRRKQGERLRSFQRRELSVDRHVEDLLAVYASLTPRRSPDHLRAGP